MKCTVTIFGRKLADMAPADANAARGFLPRESFDDCEACRPYRDRAEPLPPEPDTRPVPAAELRPGDVIELVEGFRRVVAAVDPRPDDRGEIRVWLDTDHDAEQAFKYLPTEPVRRFIQPERKP